MWLTKKLEQSADKLEAEEKVGEKERMMFAEAMRDRDWSATPEQTESAPRPNTKNPPPIAPRGPEGAIAQILLLILLGIMIWVLLEGTIRNMAMALLVLISFIRMALSGSPEKPREPFPLVSWFCEYKTEGHTIELAFQMPPEYNTPQTRERIGVATRVILRNFKAETLQDTLETSLFKEVSELKIPVFRIQILAIDKVAVPTPEPAKEKEKSLYI